MSDGNLNEMRYEQWRRGERLEGMELYKAYNWAVEIDDTESSKAIALELDPPDAREERVDL